MSPFNSWLLPVKRLALRRCAQKLEVVSRCFQRRVDLKRLPVVSDGLSFVAHRLVGPAQVAIGKGRFRVDLKGLVQVGDGVVELSLFIVGATPVGVGGGIVWVELNGLGEVGDGAVEIKCLEMRGPPSEVRGGIIGDWIQLRWCNPRSGSQPLALGSDPPRPLSRTAKVPKKT